MCIVYIRRNFTFKIEDKEKCHLTLNLIFLFRFKLTSFYVFFFFIQKLVTLTANTLEHVSFSFDVDGWAFTTFVDLFSVNIDKYVNTFFILFFHST